MTEIKTAQAWGCVIADDDCGDIVDAIALRMPAGIFKTPVVIVHGLTEAEVHEAAALLAKSREVCEWHEVLSTCGCISHAPYRIGVRATCGVDVVNKNQAGMGTLPDTARPCWCGRRVKVV